MPATQYAILQKDGVTAGAEQIRRAFRSFANLTDADAVRLAANAQGILLRHLNSDEARAFHRALQAEGVASALVSESELRLLPESRSLHRLALSPTGLEVYDLLGRPKPVPWGKVALVAAGAVGHAALSLTQTERTTATFHPALGVWPKKIVEAVRRIETGSELILEIVLTDGATRYEINAAQFPFKYVVDRPEFSTVEKFVWLVREIAQHATEAILNRGARDVRDGIALVRGYTNRQAFTDELLWLLWNATRHKHGESL
jgi:hypothetical protein